MSTVVKKTDVFINSDKPLLLLIGSGDKTLNTLSEALQVRFDLVAVDSFKQAGGLITHLSDKPFSVVVDLKALLKANTALTTSKLLDELEVSDHNFEVLASRNEHSNVVQSLTRVLSLKWATGYEIAKANTNVQNAGLLGKSLAMDRVRVLIRQFADTPFPVLLEGESGTGKELIAKELHSASERSESPYLTLNCAAFTAELLETQLFGHAKGAFTGATSNKVGFFEEAGDGTLFLDEVGEIPLVIQSKLLRVLENGEFYRVGETKPRRSHARVIAATNRKLKDEVHVGEFRQDLYHRLSVLTIPVPTLKERTGDVAILINHFKQVYATMTPSFEMTEEAISELEAYCFPGNIRELKNIVIRLLTKYAGRTVSVEDLRPELESSYDIKVPKLDGEAFIEGEFNTDEFSLDEKLIQWEEKYINYAIAKSDGNLAKAARMLGINRTTLYSRLKRVTKVEHK